MSRLLNLARAIPGALYMTLCLAVVLVGAGLYRMFGRKK